MLTINFPANFYLIKVNNKNSKKRCEICSKLTIKTSERCYVKLISFIAESLNKIIFKKLKALTEKILENKECRNCLLI